MIFLPDTNVLSAYLAGRSPALVERMQREFAAGSLRFSVMVMAELEFGAEKARTCLGVTRFVRRVEALRRQVELEPLGRDFPRIYARVRAEVEAGGQKIGDRDTIIAAHALCLNATLVTRNIREFARVSGLSMENWQTD
ncbi:MAG: type II toxin-antitoxin system VapC family toxin [Verrucomicrobia bacterium]|nr:type II toxin-antitoxin system VapC family toxin [Verrucomicrobiota bacterium]